MKDATYILRKHRVYICPVCGGECHRPLQAADTEYRPFPKPCECCDQPLDSVLYRVVDTNIEFRDLGQR